MSSFSDRLREERLRLDMVQPEFAGLGGVGKQSQINYESGKRMPDAAYLAALAEHGVDVGYLVTGERSTSPVDRSMLGVPMSEFVQVRYWRVNVDASIEQVGEYAFLSAWLRERSRSPGQCHLLKVSNDRMQPTIPVNAVVLFDHSQQTPRDDALFVLRLDDGLGVRRLRQIGRDWRIECDNRTYSDRLALDKQELGCILGEVLWQCSTLFEERR